MKMRKNARLTPLRREEMARRVIAGEMSRPEAARSFGVGNAKFHPPRALAGPRTEARCLLGPAVRGLRGPRVARRGVAGAPTPRPS